MRSADLIPQLVPGALALLGTLALGACLLGATAFAGNPVSVETAPYRRARLPAAAVIVSLVLIGLSLLEATIAWAPFWTGILLYLVASAWWIATWAIPGGSLPWRLTAVWLPTAPLVCLAVASISIALRTRDEAGLAAELFGVIALPLVLFSAFATVRLVYGRSLSDDG